MGVITTDDARPAGTRGAVRGNQGDRIDLERGLGMLGDVAAWRSLLDLVIRTKKEAADLIRGSGEFRTQSRHQRA